MDKTQLDVQQTFVSKTQEEREQNLQRAVDQYLLLLIKNGKIPGENRKQP